MTFPGREYQPQNYITTQLSQIQAFIMHVFMCVCVCANAGNVGNVNRISAIKYPSKFLSKLIKIGVFPFSICCAKRKKKKTNNNLNSRSTFDKYNITVCGCFHGYLIKFKFKFTGELMESHPAACVRSSQ